MSKYVEQYPSVLLRFEDPFAYISLTDFGNGIGLIQIYSECGSYTYKFNGMDSGIVKFLSGCTASYIHSKLKECITYKDKKVINKHKLDLFIIRSWPSIREKLIEFATNEARLKLG